MQTRTAIILLSFLFIFIASCDSLKNSAQLPQKRELPFTDKNGSQGLVKLDSIDVGLNMIKVFREDGDTLIEESRTLQPFSIYRIHLGDVDGDNQPEIILGVEKKNMYDPELRRRLFIYSIRDFNVEPKWLGTYLIHELLDFKMIEIESISHFITIEKIEEDSFAVIEYAWIEFGPELLDYRAKGGSYEEVLSYFSSFN